MAHANYHKEPMTMYIREMTLDDAGEVAAVHADAGAIAYRDYGQDAVAEWIRGFASPEHIIERLEASQLGLVAVDDQNCVVGSILIGSATRGSNVIGGLYVSNRGRGVGTALLHEALGWLRCSGSELAHALVMERNAGAMSFFARHGFSSGDLVPSAMFAPSGRAREMLLFLA